METKTWEETADMLGKISTEICSLQEKMDSLIATGNTNTHDFKELYDRFNKVCGAAQGLQWVLKFRDDFQL